MTRIWVTPKTTLAVGTSIYAAGDALGAKASVKVPNSGIIRAIAVTDVDDEASVDVRVWLFESEPTGIAANAAFALADADLLLVQGVVDLNSTDDAHEYDAINGRAKYRTGLAIPYRVADEDGLLHFQCECEAGTPTFTATTDVAVQFFIEW